MQRRAAESVARACIKQASCCNPPRLWCRDLRHSRSQAVGGGGGGGGGSGGGGVGGGGGGRQDKHLLAESWPSLPRHPSRIRQNTKIWCERFSVRPAFQGLPTQNLYTIQEVCGDHVQHAQQASPPAFFQLLSASKQSYGSYVLERFHVAKHIFVL